MSNFKFDEQTRTVIIEDYSSGKPISKIELLIPTITDCGMSFQTAPAKCQCGWEQSGKWLKQGFIADAPVGYYNLRTLGATQK